MSKEPQTTSWLPGKDAPKDGTHFWGYLYDSGIRKLRWSTAEEAAAEENGDPENYRGDFVEVRDTTETWSPKWWLPLNALPEPPDDRI